MDEDIRARLGAMNLEEKVRLLGGDGLWRTQGLPRLGIAAVLMTDGTQGVRYSIGQIDGGEGWGLDAALRADDLEGRADAGVEALFGLARQATCFPSGSCLGCCWDPALLREMGHALAEECQEMGVGLLLGPGVNLRRTPLAGRGYEYYAEDPLLTGELAAALIEGLQARGVGACLKHLACNNSEYRRTEMDSVVAERPLRELYLRSFQHVLERVEPWALMSAYNRLNGTQAAEHPWLLTRVLREEWGYQGPVISDWHGIKDRPAALLAGNDLAMPESRRQHEALLEAVLDGRVSRETLDRSCERVLRLVARVEAGRRPDARADHLAHHRLARRLAAESLVMLKNEDDVLPIGDEVRRIAVIGSPALQPVIQGSGCATTRARHLDVPLEEIRALAGDARQVEYAMGTRADGAMDPMAEAEAMTLARRADLVVLFVSTPVGMDGENGDRRDLDILPAHARLLDAVAGVQSRLVVVLSSGDAVLMPWLEQVRALLLTFFGGQGMGHAVAEVLFGRTNPSGRLSVTFPNSLEETPAHLGYPGEQSRHLYGEGLFVGYRYYDKRRIEPRFPFGFGLGYSRFDYRDLRVSQPSIGPGQTLWISLELTNLGPRPGQEVVQLYVAPPAGELLREPQALRAFAKVALAVGERRRVELALEADALAHYDPQRGRWVLAGGVHQLRIGSSSRDIRLLGQVRISAPPCYPVLSADSSLAQLLRNPPAFAAVARLVSRKSGVPVGRVRRRLAELAPSLFAGLYVSLVELLRLEVSEAELERALRQGREPD